MTSQTSNKSFGSPALKDIQDHVNLQFRKIYTFPVPRKESLELPPLEAIFSEPVSNFESLQKLKAELNKVKNRLNNFDLIDWHNHTRNRSSLMPIIKHLRQEIQAEFVTQAFVKLYECVSRCELVPSDLEAFYSVHLCEAPGAFITGLNHYLKYNFPGIRWQWFANTLNPYYEGNDLGSMITDDRFILPTLDSWCFGEDNTGDIMQRENVDAIVRRSKEFDMINLVTADGSIDCHDVPEDQEEHVSKLHLAEVITALKMLSPGGSFILKMFTFFEHCSVSLLYLLYVCFVELHVFKPCTSKPGNSEVYVIAKNFRKPAGIYRYLDRLFDNLHSSEAMFCTAHIPPYFVENVYRCAYLFMTYQQDVIEHNIHFYSRPDSEEKRRLQLYKDSIKQAFFMEYDIGKIKKSDTILKGKRTAESLFNICPIDNKGTFNERSRGNAINRDQQLTNLIADLNDLIKNIKEYSWGYKISKPLGIIDSCINLIRINCGKPIEILESSRFVVLPYIQFLKEVIAFVTSEFPHIEQRNEQISTFDEPTNTLVIDVKSYANMSCYSDYELDVYHILLQCVTDLRNQEGINCLTVENWLLISQFSVGLMLFLKTYVFEKVELITCNQLRFSCLKTDGIESLRYLNEALQTERNKCAPDKTILGIIPIHVLLKREFFYAVMNYNNRLCVHYCSQLLAN